MYRLMEFTMYPLVHAQKEVKSVKNIIDFILDGDLTVSELAVLITGRVLNERYFLEYHNRSYVEKLADEMVKESGCSYDDIKDALESTIQEEMFRANENELKRIILQAIVDMYHGNLTESEVAKMLGVSLADVQKYVSRAKKKMRNEMVHKILNGVKLDRKCEEISISITRRITIETV